MKKENVVVVTGNLIKCRKEAKTFKGKKGEEKLYITIKDAEINKTDFEALKKAFEKSGDKFTPAWIKNFEGFVNVSTIFDLPAKIAKTKEEFKNVLEWIEENDYHNAPCKLALIIKDGAIYPNSLLIKGEGEPFNPFDMFED